MLRSLRNIRRIMKRDHTFMKKVFVSHYCNVPFHLLDKDINEIVAKTGYYPTSLVDDLYETSLHLIRNFELAPYAQDDKLEEFVINIVNKEEI